MTDIRTVTVDSGTDIRTVTVDSGTDIRTVTVDSGTDIRTAAKKGFSLRKLIKNIIYKLYIRL